MSDISLTHDIVKISWPVTRKLLTARLGTEFDRFSLRRRLAEAYRVPKLDLNVVVRLYATKIRANRNEIPSKGSRTHACPTQRLRNK